MTMLAPQITTNAQERASLPGQQRPLSIDLLRGAVMLIMTLGHVRHMLHITAWTDDPTNLATTTPALFFTRWVSHYCASIFLLLSGMSAFLSGQRKTKQEQSLFLIKRGLWLVAVEVVIITFGLTFDPLYHNIILQVIWATGWSMVVLGLLVRAPFAVIVTTGCVLVAGHNLLDYAQLPEQGAMALLLKFLLTSSVDMIPLGGGRSVMLVYAVLPWTGVMLLGYSFGFVYRKGFDPAQRRKILLLAGAGFVCLFLVLRLINGYGDPAPWGPQKNVLFTFLSFLNVTKYPVSLQYTCITVGPALMLLAFLEKRSSGRAPEALILFGRVPFFYYVLHFFLIHLICMVLFFATGHTWQEAMTDTSFMKFRPLNFGFSLGVVYLLWPLVVFLLYFPCRWYAQYKRTHRYWWLRYV